MRSIDVALVAGMFLLCSHSSGSVYAYLDPGTGSIALQLILGGVVAVLATARLYWTRLKTLAGRGQADSDTTRESH